MKKWYFLPAVTALLAGVGYGVRTWQLATGFEGYGLAIPGAAANIAAVILAALAAVAALALAKWSAGSYTDYASAFTPPTAWLIPLYVAAGALVALSGLAGLADYRAARVLEPGPLLSQLIASLLAIPGGVALAALGTRPPARGKGPWLALVPGYTACISLVYVYQTVAAEPTTLLVLFRVLGALAAALALYWMAAFAYEKPKAVPCAAGASVAVVFLVTDLADGRGLSAMLLEAGLALYLLTQLTVLLYRGEHPLDGDRMCPPETARTDPAAEAGEETEAAPGADPGPHSSAQ